MFPPTSFLLLLPLVLLVSISAPAAVASPLSTVAISHASNVTVVCALLHSAEGYDLTCTSILPQRERRTYRSGLIASSALAGGDGFLCFLSLSANLSTMVWWDFYQQSGYYGPSRDYKRVYRGPPLADLSSGDSRVCAIQDGGGGLRQPTCWRWKQLVLPAGLNFADIAVGGEFVCGLLLGSWAIRCFGNDTSVVDHQPAGAYFTIAAGSRHACAVSKEGKLVCWGAGAPDVGETSFEISSLALGEGKTCVLGSNGTVTCWGEYSSLPCSLANTEFMAIQAKGRAICGILKVNYSLACWGSDILYQNPVVYDRVLPGPCVPPSSCGCGPLEGSGTFCQDGKVVCHLCENEKLVITPSVSPSPPPQPPPRPSSPDKPPIAHKRRMSLIVVGSVGFAIGLVALVSFCLFYFSKCSGRVHDASEMQGAAGRQLPPGCASALARIHGVESSRSVTEWRFSSLIGRGHSTMVEEFPLSLLLAVTDNFAESHKIGSGSFGSVYRATLDDDRVVAIKRAEASASSSNTIAAAGCENKRPDKEWAFLAELALLSRVNHKNLVRLLGYCKQGAERVLVYEFTTNGTLHDHLHKFPPCSIATWGARLHVALDAARGLEYLHVYAVPPIIHRDIKSSNILLDDGWTAKVSDFGLSLMSPADEDDGTDCPLPVRAAGTVGYMDPEYYRLQHLTFKSDVYSFGVVLLELLTGCKVINRYEDSGTPKNVVDFAVPLIAADDIHRVLDPKLPPPTPSEIEAVTYVGYLAIDCVSPEGRERPTMTEVVSGLERAVAACDAAVAPSLSRSDTVRKKKSWLLKQTTSLLIMKRSNTRNSCANNPYGDLIIAFFDFIIFPNEE